MNWLKLSRRRSPPNPSLANAEDAAAWSAQCSQSKFFTPRFGDRALISDRRPPGSHNARLFLGEGRFPAPATIEYGIFEVGSRSRTTADSLPVRKRAAA